MNAQVTLAPESADEEVTDASHDTNDHTPRLYNDLALGLSLSYPVEWAETKLDRIYDNENQPFATTAFSYLTTPAIELHPAPGEVELILDAYRTTRQFAEWYAQFPERTKEASFERVQVSEIRLGGLVGRREFITTGAEPPIDTEWVDGYELDVYVQRDDVILRFSSVVHKEDRKLLDAVTEILMSVEFG